jgi:hypothetical protein
LSVENSMATDRIGEVCENAGVEGGARYREGLPGAPLDLRIAADVVRLQRMAGNRAVSRLLERRRADTPMSERRLLRQPHSVMGIPIGGAASLDSLMHAAILGRWPEALTALSRLDAATRQTAINNSLDDERLAHLVHAAVGTLRSELETALRARPGGTAALVEVIETTAREDFGHDWLGAARELRGLGADDLSRVLGNYNLAQLSGLRGVTTGQQRRWFSYLAAPVGAAYLARLTREFDDAVGRRDAAAALRLADLFDDAAMRSALQRADTAGLTGQMATLSPRLYPEEHRVRRTLRYLLHPADFGAAARPAQTQGATGAGTLSTPPQGSAYTPVPGGQVSVTTNDTINTGTGPFTDAFTVHYQDTAGSGQAPSTGWIQFIALELESLDSGGDHLDWYIGTAGAAGQPTQIDFSQGSAPADLGMGLGHWQPDSAPTRPDERRWQIDSLSDPRPFAEGSQSTSNISALTTDFSDRPTDDWQFAAALFSVPRIDTPALPAATVVERTWFEDYLVRGHDVLFVVSILCEDVWTRRPTGPQQSVRTTREVGRRSAHGLRRAQWNALRGRMPSYAVYEIE